MTEFSDKFLAQLAGCLYDGLIRKEVKPGFTVGDIVRSGLPMIDNTMLASIALQRLIGDGVIHVRMEHDGKSKEMRYYLKYPVPEDYVKESETKEPEVSKHIYKTREIRAEKPASSRSVQIGGNHYVDMAIQPIDYIVKNNIGFLEGNVIKYVSRWKSKNGVEDLRKARHYLDMLIEGSE